MRLSRASASPIRYASALVGPLEIGQQTLSGLLALLIELEPLSVRCEHPFSFPERLVKGAGFGGVR